MQKVVPLFWFSNSVCLFDLTFELVVTSLLYGNAFVMLSYLYSCHQDFNFRACWVLQNNCFFSLFKTETNKICILMLSHFCSPSVWKTICVYFKQNNWKGSQRTFRDLLSASWGQWETFCWPEWAGYSWRAVWSHQCDKTWVFVFKHSNKRWIGMFLCMCRMDE